MANPFALNEAATAVSGSLTVFFQDSFAGLFASQSFGVVAGTDSVFLQVRAWDNAGGTLPSWDAAWQAALNGSDRAVGWSKVFVQPVVIGGVPPPGMFNFESFNIFIVPEPGTLSLIALGGAALFWSIRPPRRKRSME